MVVHFVATTADGRGDRREDSLASRTSPHHFFHHSRSDFPHGPSPSRMGQPDEVGIRTVKQERNTIGIKGGEQNVFFVRKQTVDGGQGGLERVPTFSPIFGCDFCNIRAVYLLPAGP